MMILGISAFYHDSAVALVQDGEIIAAAQEECFSRKKHDPRFPKHALEYCLRAGKTTPGTPTQQQYLEAALTAAGRVFRPPRSFGERLDLDRLLDLVDGVLITGSKSNVHPSLYGGETSERNGRHHPARDATTLPPTRRAIHRRRAAARHAPRYRANSTSRSAARSPPRSR